MLRTIALILVGVLALSQGLPSTKKFPGRIVGGQEANQNEFPFMVSVQYLGSHLCGGTLIRANAVVTAAHCAEVGTPDQLSVVAGKHNIRTPEATQQARNVSSVQIHPGYPGITGFENDVAVLKTTTDFVYNGAVGPLSIAPRGHLTTGNATVIGWGITREGGTYPDNLQKVQVPVVTDSECAIAHGSFFIGNQMLCAGTTGKDSCEGDSGGPLVSFDVNRLYLAGIVSWGLGCARPGFPGVYTEVANFVDFIENASQ